MSLSVKAVVTLAFQQIGVISPEEELDGENAILGATLLNNLVAQLNGDQLFPFSRIVYDFLPLTPKNIYTVGIVDVTNPITPPADIPIVRPAFINRCLYYPGSSTSGTASNVQQLDITDLVSRRRPLQTIGSPMYFAMDGAYPLSNLYLDCKPQPASQITLICNRAIPTVGINDNIQIPPEFADLLITATARKAAVYRQMPVETKADAEGLYNEALSRIRAMNMRLQHPTLDELDGSMDIRSNNIYSGQSGR